MKLRKVVAVSGLAALMVCSFGYAEKSNDKKEVNPYSDCGLGAAIFADNGTAAALSNVIWDLGTTAITSGVSTPSTCSSKEKETASFIYKSYNEVAEQTAKGEGSHLTAMLNLAGCEAASHQEVIAKTRVEFAKEISDSSYTNKDALAKATNYYNIVASSTKGLCALS